MKKLIVFVLLFLSVCTVVRPHARARIHIYSPEGEQNRRKVGLVLSGGGAKGVAHVGVLRVLEEAGIPIDYIAGTSMGAIVGGLYAIGYTVDELDSMIRTQNWPALLRDRVPRADQLIAEREISDRYILSVPLSRDRRFRLPSGFLAGQNVYNLLSELTIGYHDSIPFHALPIPFTCIAYDMVTGSEVRLCEGVLPVAIRASMSIPGAFTTVTLDSLVLVDGGVINNFPVNVVREMGAEIVIGSDVTSGMKTSSEEIRSLMNLIDQFTSIIGRDHYRTNLEGTDLYIHPDISSYGAGSFSKEAIDTLLRRGEEKAREQWDEIVALKRRIGIDADEGWRRPTIERYRYPEQMRIGRIIIEGVGATDERIIRRRFSIGEHSRITITEIQREINELLGTGMFSNVTYQLSGDAPFDLTIYLEGTSRNSLNLGFRFDTEEMAAILLNATLGSHSIRGSAFELTGRLSQNPFIRGNFVIGNSFLGMGGISYMFKYNSIDLYERGRKQRNMTFSQHLADLSVTGTGVWNARFTLGLQYQFFDYRAFLFSGDDPNPSIRGEGLISYYFDALWETINNRYYPTRGISLRSNVAVTTDNFVRYRDSSPFTAITVGFNSAVSVSDRVTFLPSFYGRVLAGSEIALTSQNYIGGMVSGRYMAQQLPFIGLRNMELAEHSILIGRLDLRVRLWRRHYASLLANYGQESDDLRDIIDGKSLVGGGLGYSFDSPIGPIQVLFDYSNRRQHIGFFFSLGRHF